MVDNLNTFACKNYQIRLLEPKNKAVLTHYLHNVHNGVSKHYKEDAFKVIKKINI